MSTKLVPVNSAPAPAEAVQPAPAEVAQPAPAEAPRQARPRSRARLVFLVLLGLALAGGGLRYFLSAGRVSTDDAQVEGHIVDVSARVQGQVAKVLVHDNQLVHAGDVLVELDSRDLNAKLDAARADALSAQAQLDSAQAQLELTRTNADSDLKQARSDVSAASARYKLASVDLERARKLTDVGVLPRAELDTKQAAYTQAQAALEQARSHLSATEASVQSAPSGRGAARANQEAPKGAARIRAAQAAVELAETKVQQALAAQKLAELAVSYAQVRAPVTGVVSRRTVEAGQQVGPERALMALIPTDDVWVVANFKESQVGRMRPGQPVDVKVDTYGGRRFKGYVASIAAASGARFALLPPDNASGNFVKVVQRIPVLVRLTGDDLKDAPLRPGMSTEVTVDLRGSEAGGS